MAGKRQATTNLNHDNWDHEEEPEERGTFRTATEEELKTRVIKKARRKVAGASVASSTVAESGEEDSSKSKSVFSGFSGFGKPATSTATPASPFAFLAKIPKASADAAATSSPSAPTFSFLGSSSSAGDKPAAKSAAESAFPKPTTSIFGCSSVSSTETIPKASTSIFGTSTMADGAIPKLSASIFGNPAAEKKESVKSPAASKTPAASSTSSTASSGSKPANASCSAEFRASVAELNRAVMKFLKEHMDKNPYVILSPVFKNYDKYLKELRSEDSAATNDTKPTPATPSTVPKLPTLPSFSPPPAATTAAPTFSLGTEPRDVSASTAKPAATFSFGKPNTPIGGASTLFGKKPNCTVTSGGTTTTTTTPLFAASTSTSSFGGFGSMPEASSGAKTDEAIKPGFFSFGASQKKDEPVATPPKTNGFSFGLKTDDKPSGSLFSGFGKASEGAAPSTGFSFAPGSTPFSFGNIQPPAPSADASAGGDAEESEEPPKVEFTQVVEDDAVFSKRCKVFIKKDKDFTDRGVGTLYLKPVKDSEKTQMLVRADTNLGNILVNLILIDGIPCQRMGKNNVMMVCIPTPEEKKATSLLLRVKTSEEADELLNEIKKHIK